MAIPNWNPRPGPDFASVSRRAYFAGYSDGFYGYRFGSGDEDAHGAFSAYRPGFDDGRTDGDAVSKEVGQTAEARR